MLDTSEENGSPSRGVDVINLGRLRGEYKKQSRLREAVVVTWSDIGETGEVGRPVPMGLCASRPETQLFDRH